MDTLAVRPDYELPAKIEDLSRFVLVGREKLVAVRAEIRAIEKLGLAKEVREQKLQEAQLISEAMLDAEVRIGQLMKDVPKATAYNNLSGKATQKDNGVVLGNTSRSYEPEEIATYDSSEECIEEGNADVIPEIVEPEIIEPAILDAVDEKNTPQKTKAEVIKEFGFSAKQAQRFQQLAEHPEIIEAAKKEARKNDDIVSRSLVLNMIRSQKKAEQIEQAKTDIAKQSTGGHEAELRIGNGIGYIPDEPYDLLLTDPPYSTDVENIDEFAQSWLPNALEHVKPTGSAYVFTGAYPEELRAYLNVKIPEHMTLKQVLIWTYKNTLGNNPKDRYKQNYQTCLFYRGADSTELNCPLTNEQWAVQEINAPDGRIGDRYHAWQKPLELAERFIRHSTKQGDTVFDPFACTGTFLLAASKLGRKGYGFEINSENADIAKKLGVKIIE